MPILYKSLGLQPIISSCLHFYLKDACPLPDIQHGKWETRIDSTPNRRIHIAKAQCNEGYLEVDVEERRCSPDGLIDSDSQYLSPNVWSGKEPECLLIGTI